MAEVTASLCYLTKENVPFIWGLEHNEAFWAAKKEIQHTPLLAYYDPRKPTVLQMVALGYGLGALIIQNNKPIAYASKALQQHEQGYVALECEALAIAWTLEKHHPFLYGHCFNLETDKKLLETILN